MSKKENKDGRLNGWAEAGDDTDRGVASYEGGALPTDLLSNPSVVAMIDLEGQVK
jgi:hypothetical protein